MSKLILENETMLLQQLRAGDVKAFETLFRFYHKPLRYFAREFLKDDDESEDTIQQVFINIWERRNELNISSSFKSYVYTAVRNTCLKKLDKTKHTLATDWEDDNDLTGSYSAVARVQEKDLGKAIEKAIADLPERCRLVFRLSRFGNLTYQEIANELEISIKTVENQMGKALACLRVALKHHMVWLLSFLTQLF